MDGKARYISPAVMSAMMVFMVTFIVTISNLGFPVARRLTGRIVATIDGTS